MINNELGIKKNRTNDDFLSLSCSVAGAGLEPTSVRQPTDGYEPDELPTAPSKLKWHKKSP